MLSTVFLTPRKSKKSKEAPCGVLFCIRHSGARSAIESMNITNPRNCGAFLVQKRQPYLVQLAKEPGGTSFLIFYATNVFYDFLVVVIHSHIVIITAQINIRRISATELGCGPEVSLATYAAAFSPAGSIEKP